MLTTFFAREVARLAGFETVVMLNYLEQSGTFVREQSGKPHHGKRRLYTYRDLVVLRAINRLLAMGARPKRIQEAIETFIRLAELPADADALSDFARKSALFVVTHDAVLYAQPEGLVELGRNGQLAFSFLIDSARALEPVAAAVLQYAAAVDREKSRNKAVLERVLARVGTY
jgi:DNA-binding transcriptional MerR regulator